MARKHLALRRKFGFQFKVVVDLAVVRDDIAGVLTAHGLAGGVGQVDDRQARVAQLDKVIGVDPCAIGAAMGKRFQRPGRQWFASRRLSVDQT